MSDESQWIGDQPGEDVEWAPSMVEQPSEAANAQDDCPSTIGPHVGFELVEGCETIMSPMSSKCNVTLEATKVPVRINKISNYFKKIQ